ncbi:ferrous iron transport protein A [Desulfovibrio subterraneus]|jgi:ferrous iron transport protein A|uniref:FeoA family protein n=1 Tax=Desulfovibrio subterraneus TaxID=2718620 RepID=UPI0022B93216|nr:FeoA family protein [Desulfovibrio subterraneus]WBF68719.1 ferrous iron transport protein A [Desulfovibrio subterraneus]
MNCCTLDKVPAGCKATIRGYCGCSRERGRLCALGLTPGTVVEVCAPCSVRVRESCVALGIEVAGLVTCEPLENDAQPKGRVA